jgi:hypothetical protein
MILTIHSCTNLFTKDTLVTTTIGPEQKNKNATIIVEVVYSGFSQWFDNNSTTMDVMAAETVKRAHEAPLLGARITSLTTIRHPLTLV